MTGDSEASVAELETLALDELRAIWAARFGAPPRLRSKALLALMLGWRIQVQRESGLSAETRRALRRPSGGRPRSAPAHGTRLAREWGGRRHEVTVAGERQYLYGGQTYASLSQVARTITGVRWNGPRFFGLRDGGTER